MRIDDYATEIEMRIIKDSPFEAVDKFNTWLSQNPRHFIFDVETEISATDGSLVITVIFQRGASE